MTGLTMSPFDPASAFADAWQEELDSAGEGAEWRTSGRPTKEWPSGEDAAWWAVNGPLMVQRWIDWRRKTPWDIWVTPDGEFAREIELKLEIGGQLFKNFVDVVFATDGNNGRVIVTDIKSGARPPQGVLQLGIYKAAIETMWPDVKVAGGTYWDARKGEITGVVNLDWCTPAYVAALAKRVKLARAAGLFVPNVSNLCNSCSVGKYCAINRGSEAHYDPDFALMN